LGSLKKLMRSANGSVGLVIVGATIVAAIFAPLLTPYSPTKQSLRESLEPPSIRHLAGTDRFGRDLLTRMMFGARISLMIGLSAMALGLAVGGFLGIVGGVYGGYVDTIIQRVIDVLMSFPSLVLALLLSATLGGGLGGIVVAIGVYNASRFARLFRAQVLQVREEMYIESARAIGASTLRIVARHIVPNIAMPIVILATLRLSAAILIEASLSYLGLGVRPPTPTWGNMVAEGRLFLLSAPWVSLVPGGAIMLLSIGISLLGDGLRDVFDPRLRGT